MPEAQPHIPVLLDEVCDALQLAAGDWVIDATFGAGGYSRAILGRADCHVIGLDRDPTAIANGERLVETSGDRLHLVKTRFGDMGGAVADVSAFPGRADAIVFDLGVSSMQLDQAARGFSFQADGPLDMRMTQDGDGAGWSAADLVNSGDETTLADLLFHYGEERRSRAIAKAIVKRRAETPFETTGDLAGLVERVLGRKRNDPKHPATRTFQALRIAVNDEFQEIAIGLAAAEALLAPGGRLVVVTFHSIEDRIVKRFLADRSGRTAGGSRHLPEKVESELPSFQLVNQRPLTPNDDELGRNPRARSAKLRAAVRTDAPATARGSEDCGVHIVPMTWA